MIQIIAVLDVLNITLFKEYESQALSVMSTYGGHLSSAFKTKESEGDLYREVHILSFPNEKQFHSYCNDSALLRLNSLREQAISSTQVFISEKFQEY
ncbi:MAG: DUF1330 domain-containing protein [Cellvibrionaceae bacterium]